MALFFPRAKPQINKIEGLGGGEGEARETSVGVKAVCRGLGSQEIPVPAAHWSEFVVGRRERDGLPAGKRS